MDTRESIVEGFAHFGTPIPHNIYMPSTILMGSESRIVTLDTLTVADVGLCHSVKPV